MALQAPFDDDDYEFPEGSPMLHAWPDDEGEEEELSAAYGSLTSFTPRAKKKKPVLVVDAEELALEREALMQGQVIAMEEDEPHRAPPAMLLGLTGIGAEDDDDEDLYAMRDEDIAAEPEDEEEPDLAALVDPDRLLRPQEAARKSDKPKKQMLFNHRDEADAASEPADFGTDDFSEPFDIAAQQPHQPASPVEPTVAEEPEWLLPHNRGARLKNDLPDDGFMRHEELDELAERLFGPAARKDTGTSEGMPGLPETPVTFTPATFDPAEPPAGIFSPFEAAEDLSEPDGEPEFDAEPEPAIVEAPVDAAAASAERSHVMREYAYEEPVEPEPEPDYEEAQVVQSRLRARLVREAEEAEPVRVGILAKFWRWVTGRS